MKALKWIAIVIVILLAAVTLAGFILPKETRLSVSEEISLPPDKVFHFVAAFVDRTAWDPWIKADTAVKCVFDIVPGYVGSKYNWEGPVVGKGHMMVDSVASGTFIRNQVSLMPGKYIPEEWQFTPSEKGTSLTWTIIMRSGSPYGRLANVMMKGIILKTMESGKTDLRNYLEANGVTLSTLTEIGIEEYPAVEALTLTAVMQMDEMPAWFGQSLARIMAALQEQNIQPQGSPFALYTGYDGSTGRFTMTAGIPVSAGGKTRGDIKLVKYDAFIALKGLHTGPYDELMISYRTLESYAGENGIELEGAAWEFYLSDPAEVTDPTQLLTLVAMPLKTR
jgi:effector-binding domain-containing protein